MAQTPTTPVRLKDIARDLNVSVMTVSKVVRGCADVGAETRSRVLARIKELNYQPNWVARSLAARRTFIIGLIVPDLMTPSSPRSPRASPPPSGLSATTW